MKRIFLIVAVVATAGVPAAQGIATSKFYASRYEHLDVEVILNNRRMVNYYAACLLNQGPCPPQGLELKKILPEALETNCGRCSEKQKVVAYRSIKRLKKEYPKIWEQLSALWDPDDRFIKKFEMTLENTDKSNGLTSSSTTTTTTTELVTMVIGNRFGDEDNAMYPYPPPQPTPSKTTLTSSTFTNKPTSKPSTFTSPSTDNTNKPYTSYNTFSTRQPPLASLGANIQATVSFGTNIVGGVIKGLGDFGNKVVETGSKLAEAVLTTVRAVVQPLTSN